MTVKVSKPAINVREELADLRKPTGIAGEAMLRAETPQEQFNLIGAGRRNLIINGNFQVSQRGDYSSATSLPGTETYLVDRWKFYDQGVSGTATHSTKMIRLAATSTGTGQVRTNQYIETQDILPNQTYVLSAYVKSNKNGAGIAVFDDETSGSGDTDVYSALHSGSGGWERLSVSFTTRAAEPYQCFVRLALTPVGSGSITSGDYLEVKEVQLELGKVATPFEHRSYGEELALAQRFYFKMDFPQTSSIGEIWKQTTDTLRCTVTAPVCMRTTPSINATGQPGWGVSWTSSGTDGYYFSSAGNKWTVTSTSLDNQRIGLQATGITGLANTCAGLFAYTGDLNFDAEL